MNNESQKKLDETLQLYADLESFKTTGLYKLIAESLEKEMRRLKNAYDCETIEEMATLRGEKCGLSFFADLLGQIERDGELAKEQSINASERAKRDEADIDSTGL